MEINIGVGVKLDNNTVYDMSLNIPAGELSAEKPFKFAVSQINGKGTESEKKEDVLLLAFSDASHVCLRVKPPTSLLEQAKIDGYIDNLQAVVEEGNYDETTGNFRKDSGDSDTKSGNE